MVLSGTMARWGLVCAVVFGPLAAWAEDFDAFLFTADTFLGSAAELRGTDNDANGIDDDDHLGLLGALLAEDANPSCIAPARLNEIRAGYDANFAAIPAALRVNVLFITVDLLDDLRTSDPALAEALQALLAGYITIAEPGTLDFVNDLADLLVARSLQGTPQESEIPQIQAQIDFQAGDYATFGSAAGNPNYLGATGDLDQDGATNRDEYLDPPGETREGWLTDHCLEAALRLVRIEGAGTFLSGRTWQLTAEAAGAVGPYTYTWFRGTPPGGSVAGSGSALAFPFLNASDAGEYYVRVAAQNGTTLDSPVLRLNVVDFPLSLTRPINGGTRPWGGSFTFEVGVQGGGPGPYEFTWLRDGAVVSSGAPTLTLSPLTQADSGAYTVAITSNGGADTITSGPVTLTVLPPNFRISQQPQNANPALGADATLSVAVAGGSGDYRYDWSKNGQLLGIESTPTIVLENVRASDAGNYRVRVSDANDAGLTLLSRVAVVTVQPEPLSVVQNPASVSRLRGDRATFNVAVQGGSGDYAYTWVRNGQPLGAPDAPTLTIEDLVVDDAGSYWVTVQDRQFPSLSVTTSPATLTVLLPQLVLEQQPQSQTVPEGSDVTFSIVVSGGSGEFAYNWRKDGTTLLAPSAPTLTLNDVELGDAGVYTCWVTDQRDPQAQVRSAPAVLTVTLEELVIVEAPQSATVRPGDTVELRVEAAGGSGDYAYNWRRDGQTLLAPSAPTLTLDNVADADAGSYSVIVRDREMPSRQITSTPATVSVLEPLAITGQLQPVRVERGEPAAFEVTVGGGTGDYRYTWFKDDAPLAALSRPTYTVNAAQEEDAGIYRVQVEDTAFPGDTLDSNPAALTVVVPLSIEAQPQGGVARVGETRTLEVVVSGGSGNYAYSWRKDNVPLDVPDAAVLTLASLSLDDAGRYTCRITDADDPMLQIVTEAALLEVFDDLRLDEQPQAQVVETGTAITLAPVAGGGSGSYGWTWFKDSEVLDGETTATLSFASAVPGDSGLYTARVQDLDFPDDVVVSESAFVLVVDPLRIRQQPAGGARRVGESFTASFEVEGGSGALQYIWQRDGNFFGAPSQPTLALESVRVLEDGTYTCVVVDQTGAVPNVTTAPFELTVLDPELTIVQQPRGADKAAGDVHTFRVNVAGGSGQYSYAWRKGDFDVDGVVEPELTIADLSAEDSGDYQVVVTDAVEPALQAVSEPATLSVADPVQVDFDAELFVAQRFLGGSPELLDIDNDGNGLNEDDQLGLLRSVLGGFLQPDCLPAGRAEAVQAGFNTNFSRVEDELTVNAFGDFNILEELATTDPVLANALQNLLAGYVTIADEASLVFVNELADTLVERFLSGGGLEAQIPNIQAQINFTAGEYFTYGDAATEPNWLGAAGDIDDDNITNLGEWLAPGIETREDWLLTNCIDPPLRFESLQGLGTFFTGRTNTFAIEAAGGTGSYTYSWQFDDGDSVTEVSTDASFTIAFLNESDSGRYFCIVQDGVETLTTPILRVNVVSSPLIVTRPLGGGAVAQGNTFTFRVEVQGGAPGPYAYTWRRDGTVVGPNAPTFEIASATPADAGSYTVEVTADGGANTVSSGPVNLAVIEPTVAITQQPQPQTVSLGGTATFTVAAQGGSGSFNYTWLRNGNPFGAPNQPTLTIDDVDIGDAGPYRVRVADAGNAANNVLSNVAQLNITLPPLSIDTQPTGGVVEQGNSFSFTVAVSGGSGSYIYDWRRDGNSLGVPSLPTLNLNPVLAGDGGTYTCVITDQFTSTLSVTTDPAILTVQTSTILITQQPAGGVIDVGDNFTFSVAVSGGSGNYLYDWRREGASLGLASAPQITISNAQPSARGVYSVLVTDAADPEITALSNNATLAVVEPTFQITQQPAPAIRYTGESYAFTVEVSGGSGFYNYEWRQDGSVLDDAPNAPTLELNNLIEADSGLYTVLVSDAFISGNQAFSSPALLTVGPPLEITQQPVGGGALPGGSFTFNVAVAGGIGNPTYTWRFQGTAIPGAPSIPSLTVVNLDPGDEGDFDVVITDNRGPTVSNSATLEVFRTAPEEGFEISFGLSGGQVVPPTGSEARGFGSATLTPLGAPADGGLLQLEITHDLGDAQTLILFRGAPGENGVQLSNLGNAFSPITTAAGLAPAQVNEFLRGRLHVVITSPAFPAGEIRGDLIEGQAPHTADQDGNFAITLSELLRVIQFFNVGALSCDPDSEDGYAPGDTGPRDCGFHDSDYNPADWRIALTELLRLIQFFNSPGSAYRFDPAGEDGFAPGSNPL